jgi:hypothetical protein
MALYAFNGTWNEKKDGDDPDYRNTNVVRFFDAYDRNSPTHDFYVDGVGTRLDLPGEIVGGAFGAGEMSRVHEAYAHLCAQWVDTDHPDRVIDIVGFSRGAATALDFCHLLRSRGIQDPASGDLVERDPQIRFLGLWDVVGAFGLAFLGNIALNIGHHLSLPRSGVRYCFHALSLDERRLSFLPTRVNGACEVWFRGVHSDVGGGNGNRGLNDITLKWMMSKAKAAGLPLSDADIAVLTPDPDTRPHPKYPLPFDIRTVSSVDRCHYQVHPMPGWRTVPDTCQVETAADEATAREVGADGIEVLPLEVRRRILALWETAVARAKKDGLSVDPIREPLLTLMQGRIVLVTDDAALQHAVEGTVTLMDIVIRNAQRRGFPTLADFFLTEAIAHTPHLFPYTD